MWTKEIFDIYYEEYKQDWRKEYLYKRTQYFMSKYDFGNSVLLFGGALGWGGLPLLEEYIRVYNYDTSLYIQSLVEKEKIPPKLILPEINEEFDTIYFEDSLLDKYYVEKKFYITKCIRLYQPKLVLITESTSEIVIPKRENKKLMNKLRKEYKSVEFGLEYYDKISHEFSR